MLEGGIQNKVELFLQTIETIGDSDITLQCLRQWVTGDYGNTRSFTSPFAQAFNIS